MNKGLKSVLASLAMLITVTTFAQLEPSIYKNKKFTIYPNKIVQEDKYTAVAESNEKIVSDYKSPANAYASANLSFKFSINGKDNEMSPGVDHHFTCNNLSNETPLIVFGQQLKETNGNEQTYLKPETKLTVRLDMRSVLADFNKQGYFVTYKGDKIFKEDFKGVFIAGGTAPMIWDFDNLVNRAELRLKDDDGDGIFTTDLILNAPKDEKQTAAKWQLFRNIESFPILNTGLPIANAIYNMSIEEMIKAVEPDSTFRTGKEWAGVWTRDISYSIILSMAYLQPQVAIKSLMRKVNKKKRIIQDTGTGGAYPASTDRMVWATAAWEVYKATGDKDWLNESYTIIKNSIEDDMHNAYDPITGLVKGESSFLDWREQTYPRWMQPVDIYNSYNLGTNAVHFQGNIVLAEMAKLKGNVNVYTKHAKIAATIKAGINKYLWMPDKGYYAQFMYGRNYMMVSPRSEALGEALCVLFGIADEAQQHQIIAKTPVMDFGIPCIYPQIPGIPPYHNNAVWPFVQSYFALAAAKVGNEKALWSSFAAIYRAAALFATNKENLVAENGDFAGTQINSSNMLWSLSGNIALIHKTLFGIQYQADHLSFQPTVPVAFKNGATLKNFKYRNAILDIQLEGTGNKISAFYLDGKLVTAYKVPSNLVGNHSINIVMESQPMLAAELNSVSEYVSLNTPQVKIEDNKLMWYDVEAATQYEIWVNGKKIKTTQETTYIVDQPGTTEIQIVAVDKNGFKSFASEPVLLANNQQKIVQLETQFKPATQPYKGFTGNGFVEINNTINRKLIIKIDVPADGLYAIDFRYANGNGPTNTSNKCAIRTLAVGQIAVGTIVLPQRGNEEWSNWGFTNAVKAKLTKGPQQLVLSFEDWNDNMNGEVNQAMLDYLRITKL
ncbi:MAG: hypothetical protein RLY16_591 [Bacteroidota bacterium]